MRIPRRVASCRRCRGLLRLATMKGVDVIVCDECERFTYPPSIVAQWAKDLRGNVEKLEPLNAAH